MSVTTMQLCAAIGFDGSITDGLALLPDSDTLIYALGSTVVLRQKDALSSQSFLHGHSNRISCFAVSPSGRYLASGQMTHIGFIAEIILWDLQQQKPRHRLELHMGRVQSLDISSDEKHVISIGGEDDNAIVLWDVETGKAICGSPTDGNVLSCVKFLHCTEATAITGGNNSLHLWQYDAANNKLRCTAIKLGQLRRHICALSIDDDDTYLYCGTTSGDVLQVDIKTRSLRRTGPTKEPIAGGVRSIVSCKDLGVFVGGGDGRIHLLNFPTEINTQKPIRVKSTAIQLPIHNSRHPPYITSLILESCDALNVSLIAGTNSNDLYRIVYHQPTKKFEAKLLQTSPSEGINAVVFPSKENALFATGGNESIRLWHLESCRELLRIVVDNLNCHCLQFNPTGTALLSGWNDGCIRVFSPETGRLVFKRSGAHRDGIRALVCTEDGRSLITGGEDGTIRIWDLLPFGCNLAETMKEHKAAITAIAINPATQDTFISCSEDGSCVVWDLKTCQRFNSFFASTCFTAVKYHPDGSQCLTGSTDRKITYWDPFDGDAIRVMDGSSRGAVQSLAIDPSGESIISGGEDGVLRSWGYDEGYSYAEGNGHSGGIRDIAISPGARTVVSIGSEDGIFVWRYIPSKPVPPNNIVADC